MNSWKPKQKDFKRYPHFDRPLSPVELEAIATSSERVRSNPFFPLIRYERTWRPFRKPGSKAPPKVRPISYASRRDAYIFSYYRHLLTLPYEERLCEKGLDGCVIAYRKLLNQRGRGKCNIDFANDAFSRIAELGDCVVVALDIKSYFDSLDHAHIKSGWCALLDPVSERRGVAEGGVSGEGRERFGSV